MSDKCKELAQQRNEGEGNRTAAREYNEAQRRFVSSGKVEQRAQEAKRDLDDASIRRELENAEAIGRRHVAEEDPQVKRR
jgi:hypothetical protein